MFTALRSCAIALSAGLFLTCGCRASYSPGGDDDAEEASFLDDDPDESDGPTGDAVDLPPDDADGGASTGQDDTSDATDDADADSSDADADSADATDDSDDGIDAVCGNGVIEGDEACDGPSLNAKDCTDFGKPNGALACDPVACTFDTTQCCAAMGESCASTADCCGGSCGGLLGQEKCVLLDSTTPAI